MISVSDNLNQINMWGICFGHRARPMFIGINIDHPFQISEFQKYAARKAIVWLLSKAAHSVEEIAEHYGLSTQLAEYLLDELASENCIIKEEGCSRSYKLNRTGNDW